MTQPVCPSLRKKPSQLQAGEKHWYKPILNAWLWVALLGSIVWTVLTVTAAGVGLLAVEIGWVVSIIGQMTLFVVSLQMYSLHARARFQSTNPRTGSESWFLRRAIPTHGLFRTLFDIVVRRKRLLREIDVERMRKYGDMYLMFAGPIPVIVATSSALVEKMSKEYDDFSKSDPRDLNMPYYFKWVGNSNVVLANGEQWHRIRHLTHPALNSVHVFSPVFHQKAKFLCQALREKLESGQTERGSLCLLFVNTSVHEGNRGMGAQISNYVGIRWESVFRFFCRLLPKGLLRRFRMSAITMMGSENVYCPIFQWRREKF